MGNDEAALVRLSTSATLRLGIPQPYSWSTSLGINEFNTCRLECAADGLVVEPSELGLFGSGFGATNFQASYSIHQHGLSFIETD